MPLARVDDGIRIALRVTPKASADRIQGLQDEPTGTAPDWPVRRVKVQVTAAPEGGKANAAVCKLLAKTLRVPKTSLSVISGTSERNKVVHVAGNPDALESAVRDRLGI